MEEKECEEFEGFQPGDLSFSGGDFKQDWYVETGCDGSGTSQNRDAREMSEEDAGQEKRKRLINNFTKLKNFPIRPPSGRSDSRSSTRSLELGCGVMYERDCRSAASDRPTTSQWEKRQKAEAKFKESQWQNGITDWYCPQPGEELEFYLGRVSCLLERCNKGNPNVEDLRTFRKWDSFGRVGFMEDVEDSEQIASCLEPENDSELQSDIETNRDSSVSSLSEMENQYEEPPEHITLLKKQDKVKQIESAFSVSMKDEPKTQGGNTEVVEPKPAVDELICSISRELIDIRFDKPAASPNIAEPSESEISMSMPISENNQKEADLSTKPSQPEAALCSIRPLLPSPSQRPSRVAKLNWKSRLENYGVFESSSKRASSVADTKLMTFFVDRYVNYMQRVGKPVERQLVESVLEPLKDAESNRTLMSENHPVEKASMKKKMKAESREMTSSSMSFVKNKAVAKRKSVKNDSNLSASTPYDPGWRNGLPSAKSKTHLDRFSVNRRLIQRFPVKKVLSTEKKSSRRENTTALGAPQSSLHHQQMTDSLAAKTIEDTSDRDTNSRCSSVSTIESFYSASDSPLKEGFGMRTVDEQSALTALICLGNSGLLAPLPSTLSEQKTPGSNDSGSAIGKKLPLRRRNGLRLSSDNQLIDICVGCGETGAHVKLEPFIMESTCLFCDLCRIPYKKWLERPWHYNSSMKCYKGARCQNPTRATCKSCWFWRCVNAARSVNVDNSIGSKENCQSFEAASVGNTPVPFRRMSDGSFSQADISDAFLDLELQRRTGPRVKHVSRSQHVVTGLPLATFPITPVYQGNSGKVTSAKPTYFGFPQLSALPEKEKRKICNEPVFEHDMDHFEERKDYIRCRIFSNRFVAQNPYSKPLVTQLTQEEIATMRRQAAAASQTSSRELKKKYKKKLSLKKQQKLVKTKCKFPFAGKKSLLLVAKSKDKWKRVEKKRSIESDPEFIFDQKYEANERRHSTRRDAAMSAEYPPTFPVKEESDNSEGNLLAECSDAGATRINTLDPSSLFVVKRKSRGEMKRPKTKKYLGTKIFSRAKGSVSPSTYLDETLAELLSGASNNLNAEDRPIEPPKIISSKWLPGSLLNDHCYCAIYDESQPFSSLPLQVNSPMVINGSSRPKNEYSDDPLLMEGCVSNSDTDADDKYGIQHFTQGPDISRLESSEGILP